MTAAEAHRYSAFVIALGKTLPERVHDERQRLHRWLATHVRDAGRLKQHLRRPTLYLPLDELNEHAAAIKALLPAAGDFDDDEVIVIDLSASSYGLMRDPFLLALADVLASRTAQSNRIVTVLFEKFPPATNLFWQALEESVPRQDSGTVIAVDRSGQTRVYGTRQHINTDLKDNYPQRQAKLRLSDLDGFNAKLLRRVGHFNMEPLSGVKRCARFFFDADKCVAELADLIEERIRDRLDDDDPPCSLVIAPGQAPWMVEACFIAGDRIGVKPVELPDELPADCPDALMSDMHILAFGFVSTGRTLRAVLDKFKEWELPDPRYAIVALSAGSEPDVGGRSIDLDVITYVQASDVPRTDCVQCALHLPHDPPEADREHHLQLTSWEFWSMLTDVDWHGESYPEDETNPYPHDPDFAAVFQEFGNWIAFKYERILRSHFAATGLLVFVAPAEPAITALIKQLEVRLENDLASVVIPRPFLRKAGSYTPRRGRSTGDRAEEPLWQRQLRRLSKTGTEVFVLDEFNASDRTRNQLLAILAAHQVRVRAYLPFVDRTLAGKRDNVEDFPLYHLPDPRP